MSNCYLNSPGALKIDLMLRGIKIEDPVVKAWACGSDGIDILLPGRTIVNIPCSDFIASTSPYIIRRADDDGGETDPEKRGYVITCGDDGVPVELVPRPAFYDRRTTTGVPFSRIATVHGSYTVVTPSPKCEFFDQSVQCRYCSGGFDREGGEGRDFTVDEVLETVEAVLAERPSEIIYLSLGFSPGPDGGVEILRPYIRAIKKTFNCLVAVEALPPKENRWIDETYALGADSVLYNLEIFDPELFEIICPGRAELIGRDRYFEALSYAAGIFPEGTVASHLIVGLEPPGSTCLGVDFLIDRGVVPILPVFRPARDRSLMIGPLTTEVIVPVYKHLYKALKASGMNCRWVRDISMVTTPAEVRSLVEGDDSRASLVDSFYQTKLGKKTAWGLSALRRKLRVKEAED